MSKTANINYPQIDDLNSHENIENEELEELLKNNEKKITIESILKSRQDKLMNFKYELIELMKKQLDTIDLIINLK